MGRLENEAVIHHFSHPHPLHLTIPSPISSPLCANCTLPCTTSPAYTCTPCNFILHASPCSQMPSLINHASHPQHPLSLLPVPAYPDVGHFNCDACGTQGHGFSYHCAACGFDLHTLCASRPMEVGNARHPHALALTFEQPYGTAGFGCDVCGGLGASQWLYRCKPCEFDAHLECGASQQVHRSGSLPMQGSPRGVAMGRPVPMARSSSGGVMRGNNLSRSGSGGGIGPGHIVRNMVQNLVSNATQTIGNKLVPGYGDNGRGRGGGPWNGPGQSGGRNGQGQGRGRGRGGWTNQNNVGSWNGQGQGGRGGGGWIDQNNTQGGYDGNDYYAADQGGYDGNDYYAADQGGDGSGNWNDYVDSGVDVSSAAWNTWNGSVGGDDSGNNGGGEDDYGAVAAAIASYCGGS